MVEPSRPLDDVRMIRGGLATPQTWRHLPVQGSLDA